MKSNHSSTKAKVFFFPETFVQRHLAKILHFRMQKKSTRPVGLDPANQSFPVFHESLLQSISLDVKLSF